MPGSSHALSAAWLEVGVRGLTSAIGQEQLSSFESDQSRPTLVQLGWVFGFGDAITQHIDLDEGDGIIFLGKLFIDLFGIAGPRYFSDVFDDQSDLVVAIADGGNAFLEWGRSGTTPTFPT